MPVKLKVTADLTALDKVKQKLSRLQETSQIALEDAVEQVKPFALDELSYVPERRAVQYDEYVSDKQRRYVYGFILEKDEAGNILPYERTGDTADGWRITVTRGGDGGMFIFENPQRAARFIGGSLAKNPTAAYRFQQPFHETTGWQKYRDTVLFWSDAIIEAWRENLVAELSLGAETQVTSRAVTPRLSRRRS